VFTKDQIATAINGHDASSVPFIANPLHASVAMIVAEGSGGPEICFIRRAEREGDPWSGHVSFPGGRASEADTTAQEVAERETLEEIGLQLTSDHHVGALPVLPQIRRGITLFPFVYCVDEATQQQATARQPEEVASVFWVPFQHLTDDKAVTTLEYDLDGSRKSFPGIQFEDHIIWGLTLHLLHGFAGLVRQPFPALDSGSASRGL